jgi:hypothetical protein
VDNVSGVEDHELADVPDEVVDAEDHVRGRGVLIELAVDPGPQSE